jgi:hypothetical protein
MMQAMERALQFLLAAAGFAAMAACAITLAPHASLAMACVFVLAWEAADLTTGIMHWAADNYGDRNTRPKIIGEILHEFQGHHDSPHDIVDKRFTEVIYPGGRAIVPIFLAFTLLIATGIVGPLTGTAMASYAAAFFISQWLHRHAHVGGRSIWQRLHLTITSETHRSHHLSHKTHYSVITGHTNWLLDRFVIYRLEALVQRLTSTAPRQTVRASAQRSA